MEPINNEKFGHFVAEQRKALGLTQKELGDRLFVSDKTVSKWERGASLPNIALLGPLADALEVTITELLNGERLAADEPLVTSDADTIVTNVLEFSLRDALSRERRRWLVLFLAACVVVGVEYVLLKVLAFSPQMETLLMSGLFLLFAAWACFTKPLLPAYYDDNKIHFVQQGPFRLNMIGLRFNNSNWPHILAWLRCVTLALAVGYPLLPLICAHLPFPPQIFIVMILALLFGPIYPIAKKYE